MYPVLYEATETAFTSNGLGMLLCTKCKVTEERNGVYECEFSIPTTALHYDDITIGRLVLCPHDDKKDLQPFVIYRKSLPIDGVVTFNAHHVSYGLANVILAPFTAVGIADTLNNFTNSVLTPNPFTYWTDKTTTGTFKVTAPVAARKMFAGGEGSLLDVFGKIEFEFDRYLVKLWLNRGADNGVTIRYGKNLADYKHTVDNSGTYNAVIPVYQDEETVVYGSVVRGNTNAPVVAVVDFSEDFEEPPTVAQLEARAASYLADNTPWTPSNNLKVDFVALWQTEEYKDVAPLERVSLCDTVTVDYMGHEVSMKVVRTEYDVLLERYTEIELGDPRTSFSESVTKGAEAYTDRKVYETTTTLQNALTDAQNRITGGMGGHVVLGLDGDGKPQEIFIMDNEDSTLAQNVLRLNVNGISFSRNGITGQYTSAWTLDGNFVANFITTGYMSCNRINGGTLTLGGQGNGDGILKIYDENGVVSVTGDKDGLTAKRLVADDYVYVDGSAGSYLKIPTEQDEESYVELDNGGMNVVATGSIENNNYTLTTNFPSSDVIEYESETSFDIIDTPLADYKVIGRYIQSEMIHNRGLTPDDRNTRYVYTIQNGVKENRFTSAAYYDEDGEKKLGTQYAASYGTNGIVLESDFNGTGDWETYLVINGGGVQIGNSLTQVSFNLNGVSLRNLARRDSGGAHYPAAAGHYGACAVREESGMCRVMSLGVNASSKILYVYGSDNIGLLNYIGRVQLT